MTPKQLLTVLWALLPLKLQLVFLIDVRNSRNRRSVKEITTCKNTFQHLEAYQPYLVTNMKPVFLPLDAHKTVSPTFLIFQTVEICVFHLSNETTAIFADQLRPASAFCIEEYGTKMMYSWSKGDEFQSVYK